MEGRELLVYCPHPQLLSQHPLRHKAALVGPAVLSTTSQHLLLSFTTCYYNTREINQCKTLINFTYWFLQSNSGIYFNDAHLLSLKPTFENQQSSTFTLIFSVTHKRFSGQPRKCKSTNHGDGDCVPAIIHPRRHLQPVKLRRPSGVLLSPKWWLFPSFANKTANHIKWL